jgi:hypothetical protein
MPIETGATMTEPGNEEGGGKVLPFKRADDTGRNGRQVAGPAAASALGELLRIYDRLIALLRETDNDGLDVLTDSLVMAVVRCRKALAEPVDDKAALLMLRAMNADLRELPRTLRSLMPGIGPRLCESMERKLGIQFARFGA